MSARDTIDWRVPASEAWAGSEADLQTELVTRVMALAGRHPEIRLLHAIPSGDWRGWSTGKKLKAQGVIPGIPDLCLPVARSGFHGLYLELKKKGGCPSQDQWRVLEDLHHQGYFVRVSNHLPTSINLITDYLNELP